MSDKQMVMDSRPPGHVGEAQQRDAGPYQVGLLEEAKDKFWGTVEGPGGCLKPA